MISTIIALTAFVCILCMKVYMDYKSKKDLHAQLEVKEKQIEAVKDIKDTYDKVNSEKPSSSIADALDRM